MIISDNNELKSGSMSFIMGKYKPTFEVLVNLKIAPYICVYRPTRFLKPSRSNFLNLLR